MASLLERLSNFNIGIQNQTANSTVSVIKPKPRFEIPISKETIKTQVAKQKGFEETRTKSLAERVAPFLTALYQYPARTLTSFGLDVAGKKELGQPKSSLAYRIQEYLLGTGEIGSVKSASERVISGAKKIQETALQLGAKQKVPSIVAFGLSGIGLGGSTFIDAYLGGGKGKIAKELTEEAIKRLGKEETEKILKEGGEKLLKEQIQSFDPLLQEAKKFKSADEFVRAQPTVYHGGNVKRGTLDVTKAGTKEQGHGAKAGLWFAKDKNTALRYGKNVNEYKIDLKNPKTIDAEGKMYGDMRDIIDEQVPLAKKEGFDGVIIKNLSDEKNWGQYNPTDHYVIFDIKSLKTKSQLTDIWNKANIKPTKIGTKERGFITSVKEITPELKIAGQYIPRSTDNLAIKAKNLIKDNIDSAEKYALQNTDDKAVAIASELIKHYNETKQYDKTAEVAVSMARKLTEQGRAIQAASILGQQTPEGQLRFAAKAIQKYNEEVAVKKGGFLGLKKQIPDLTEAQAKEITTAMDAIKKMPDGTEKAMAFYKLQDKISNLVPSPFYKKIINLWKAGLLTGIKTSGLNTFSNLWHGVSEIAKDIPAVAVDKVASLFTKERTLAFTLRGSGKGGVKEGFEKGWRYLTTGFDERNVAAKLDYHKVNFGSSKIAKGLQKYEQAVFRLMGAEDQPFYYGAKSRSMFSQAIAEAKTKKLKGETLQSFIDNAVKNPTDKMLKTATNDAEIAVFQNRTLLGNVARGIQKIPGGEIVIPFGRTPSAVAMQMINYSPVGIVKTIIENIGKGKFDQRLFSQGIGRGLVGTGVVFTGIVAYKNDLLSLDYPKDDKERKQWELEGRKENTIKMNGKWRNAAVLGPAGFVVIIGGYYQRALDESGSHSEALTQATLGGAKSLTSQTFLQGLNQFTSALNDPENYALALFSRLTGSAMPTIISDVARATDTLERKASQKREGFLAPLKSRIPFLRKTLEPQIDVFGRPIELAGNAIETMIDPSRPSRIKSSNTIAELRRLADAGFIATPTTFANEKTFNILSDEDRTLLQERAGTLLEAKLENLFKNDKYKALSDEEKQSIIMDFTSQARIIARAEMVNGLLEGLTDIEKGKKVAELKENGFLSKSVFDEWVELFDPQITLPKKSSTNILLDELQNSKDEKSLLDNVALYAKAIGTDPFTAFNRIFTGQKIRRLDNGTIIVERMSFSASEAVKEKRQAGETMYLDHTLPLQLGGSNSENNLKLVPESVWKSYTPVENYLGELLRNEQITKKEAQDLIQRFKNGKITREDIIK